MILPPGHAQAVGGRRGLRPREKLMIGGVLSVVTALAVAVVVAIASSGHKSAGGCIDVTVPYSIGGQEFFRCGAQARTMCSLVGIPGGYTGAPGGAIAAACRKAGLPVGRS